MLVNEFVEVDVKTEGISVLNVDVWGTNGMK
jgi:hypothetical protein